MTTLRATHADAVRPFTSLVTRSWLEQAWRRVIRSLDRYGLDLDTAAVARRSSCISQASSAGNVTSEGAAKPAHRIPSEA
jgi:uncharacterized lipoprotein